MPRDSELRQFRCDGCPGKYTHHEYRLWYERVNPNKPYSSCHVCKKNIVAVPRGKEEGVHVCRFSCQCDNQFTVWCRMEDTAPCYKCDVHVSPHSFNPLQQRINKKSDKVHNCSRCNGNGNCPNMAYRRRSRLNSPEMVQVELQ